MLYSEIISRVSLFMSVIGLGIVIFNFIGDDPLSKKKLIGLFIFASAIAIGIVAEMYPGRYDFCIDKGYQGQDKEAEEVVYFCYKIENGTKIMYYYDEYEIRDWEKQQLNKEE